MEGTSVQGDEASGCVLVSNLGQWDTTGFNHPLTVHSWEQAWEDAGVQQLGTEIPAPFPVLATAPCSRRAVFAGTLWKTPERANSFPTHSYTEYFLTQNICQT